MQVRCEIVGLEILGRKLGLDHLTESHVKSSSDELLLVGQALNLHPETYLPMSDSISTCLVPSFRQRWSNDGIEFASIWSTHIEYVICKHQLDHSCICSLMNQGRCRDICVADLAWKLTIAATIAIHLRRQLFKSERNSNAEQKTKILPSPDPSKVCTRLTCLASDFLPATTIICDCIGNIARPKLTPRDSDMEFFKTVSTSKSESKAATTVFMVAVFRLCY